MLEVKKSRILYKDIYTDSIINNRVSEQTNTFYNGEFDPGSG